MQHHTEQALIHQLLADGLPIALTAAVRRLLRQIQDGHTAIALDNQELAVWESSPWAMQGTETVPLRVTDHWLQTHRHHAQESRVARNLKARCAVLQTNSVDPQDLMPDADPSQQQAITGALSRQLAMVLGGPGSGKTTTAAAIVVAKYKQMQQTKPVAVALMAPTGKAAVRLTEAFHSALSRMPDASRPDLQLTATTIHRQLDQLDRYDLVLVDEASMVSLDLMDRLLTGLHRDAHLILMGDPYQLASVEAGSVLSTMALSTAFADDRFVLTGRHRTDDSVALNTIQDLCLAGDLQGFTEALNDHQIVWLQPGEEDALATHLIEGYRDYFDAVAAEQSRVTPNFQCLTSISHGVGGRHWVNRLICQEAVNRGLDGRGHRILVTENQPALGIYNGDIGAYVTAHASTNPDVWITGTNQVIPLRQIANPENAYALSIHRSQGSEFEKVLVCLPEPPEQSLYRPTRELLYTALTRAKKSVALFASQQQLTRALATPTRRDSCLERFLATD